MSKKERGAAQSADKKPLTTSRKELDSDLVIFKKVNVKEKKKQIISSGVLLLVCFGSLAYLFFFSGWQGVPGIFIALKIFGIFFIGVTIWIASGIFFNSLKYLKTLSAKRIWTIDELMKMTGKDRKHTENALTNAIAAGYTTYDCCYRHRLVDKNGKSYGLDPAYDEDERKQRRQHEVETLTAKGVV